LYTKGFYDYLEPSLLSFSTLECEFKECTDNGPPLINILF